MGKVRFMTVMVPAAAIFAALSLPASAQVSTGAGTQHVAPGKGAPQKAAPVQRGPVTGAGAHPPYRQAARPGPQGAHAGPGRPGAGRPAFYARHPGFAHRNFGGHFYRGALAWDRGGWRHEWRNGRYGWWWDVGGAWYFYEQPVYPYPTVISDVEVLEDPAMADVGPEDAPPPDAYAPGPAVVAPAPVVVAPAPVVVVPPPVVCVGPLCVR